MKNIIVIPCLNEINHISSIIDSMAKQATLIGADLIVVDGGSTDGTIQEIKYKETQYDNVFFLDNKKKIQSSAINLAVEHFGAGAEYLIRIDAHGGYPENYCLILIEEATKTGASSVVVPMKTEGFGLFQRATAIAQNSKLGTGGSKHRVGSDGCWVDHGHHALMRIDAFRSVNGYDETFTHNEDAELDYRLLNAGHKIWMTDKTRMIYYPRRTAKSLFRQYLGYGRGRARNIMKHRAIPKIRQMVPLLVAPSAFLVALCVIHPVAALPFSLWAGICIAIAVLTMARERSFAALLSGLPIMIMHMAWSIGFWLQIFNLSKKPSYV